MKVYDSTRLEDAIRGLLVSAGVCERVYSGRPKSKVQENAFAVVTLTDSIVDADTYADTHLGIHLFVRDVESEKNGRKLSYMQKMLEGCIPAEMDVMEDGEVVDSYIIDLNPLILPDVADDYGFHARILDFTITIKNK